MQKGSQATKLVVNLIRHAESQYNKAQFEAQGKEAVSSASKESIEVKFNSMYLDAGITDLGFQQCKQANDEVKQKNIKLVVVSPLKRALQTCQEIFKDHKEKPIIIVHPLFREMMLSSCDIGSCVLASKEKFPNFNFDFLNKYENPKLWVVYELMDDKLKNKILTEIKDKCIDNSDFLENGHLRLLEYMEENFPVLFEHQQDTNKRTTQQKQVLMDLAKQYNIKSDEQICVVGHSRNLEAFTCTKFGDDGSVINGRWLENCEVYPTEMCI